MHLEAYALIPTPQKLIPAPQQRDWMDAFQDGHAYRCLPLATGNTYGWQLILPVSVQATWNGGPRGEDLTVVCPYPYQAVSNFTRGILTFDIRYIFRTPPGYHLLVTGPSNTFKDGVAPMTAVIESDWLPYPFTFNYQFTRPGEVTWQAGEPYAQLCVIPAGIQEEVQPVIRNLGDNPELARDLHEWTTKRVDLLARRMATQRAAGQESWAKDYFKGRYADGRDANVEHTMKVRLKPPLDERRK